MNHPNGTNGAGTRATAGTRKIMLYSHDTFGLGHLRRNLRIAGHLLAADDALQIVLTSGSPVAGRFPLPRGLTLVELPPVRKVGPEQYEAIDARVGIGLVRRARTAIMGDVVRRFRPDVLLVDHSPAGMHGELIGVFDTVRHHAPATRVVLGLRDILDDPATVVRTWTEQDTYRIIEEAYDQVVVYGSRDVFDVGAAYGLPARVRDRLLYCGYLEPSGGDEPAGGDAPRPERPYVLATAGGGGDGADVLSGAIEAGRLLGLHVLAVTGPLMADPDYAAVQASAARAGSVELVRFHPHMQAAMASAAAIVTMGGYNSLSEAVAAGAPTVVVPRRHPRLEQTIRARLFAERGLVRVAEPGPELASRIAAGLVGSGAADPRRSSLDFGGLDRLRRALLSPPPHRPQIAARVSRRPGDEDVVKRMPA